MRSKIVAFAFVATLSTLATPVMADNSVEQKFLKDLGVWKIRACEGLEYPNLRANCNRRFDRIPPLMDLLDASATTLAVLKAGGTPIEYQKARVYFEEAVTDLQEALKDIEEFRDTKP